MTANLQTLASSYQCCHFNCFVLIVRA